MNFQSEFYLNSLIIFQYYTKRNNVGIIYCVNNLKGAGILSFGKFSNADIR